MVDLYASLVTVENDTRASFRFFVSPGIGLLWSRWRGDGARRHRTRLADPAAGGEPEGRRTPGRASREEVTV
jgi:hypothetical protein